MKILTFTVAILGLAVEALCAQELRPGAPGIAHSEEFHLGAPVSDFNLRSMDGRSANYSTLKGKVTAVMFFSTRCPMSNAFNYRRNQLYKDLTGRVNFVVVDSNSNESLEEIREYARAVGFDFPVYQDANNIVADKFGARVTTENFVMDSADVMRYRGNMEDAPNPARAKHHGLRLAIEEVLDGQPVAMPETVAFGCAIRRLQR
ncbi:MAG: redoxin domain-containing protein [Bryobacteraceae bacterium]